MPLCRSPPSLKPEIFTFQPNLDYQMGHCSVIGESSKSDMSDWLKYMLV